MLNQQPIEKKCDRTDYLDVVKVWSTIQGEGPWAGLPAIFVRLAGCNLQCPLCDTNYTRGRSAFDVETLVHLVDVMREYRPTYRVVITGGEPFRQESLVSFLWALHEAGIKTQVETNGTIPFKHQEFILPATTLVVVSPKTPVIHDWFLHCAHAFKYVVEAGQIDAADGLPVSVLGNGLRPCRPLPQFPRDRIYIQPADVTDVILNRLNIEEALRSCTQFDYRFSLQVHKYIGVE